MRVPLWLLIPVGILAALEVVSMVPAVIEEVQRFPERLRIAQADYDAGLGAFAFDVP